MTEIDSKVIIENGIGTLGKIKIIRALAEEEKWLQFMFFIKELA